MVLQKIRMAYMWCLPKRFSFLLLGLLIHAIYVSQPIVKLYNKDSTLFYLKNSAEQNNKKIPPLFQDAVLIALSHYPELSNAKINFKVKNKLTPLAARPKIMAIFQKPSKRKYIVTISKKTIATFSPILLQNLNFNSQIGVLGHEISHISEYNSEKSLFFIKLFFNHLNKKKIDVFEFNTDKRCIEHGLGYQLLSWSTEIRGKLKLTKWGGANNAEGKNERYMNPSTIEAEIKNNTIYQLK